MEKYDVVGQLGVGTFGSVAKAISKKTGQLVAIKKMKQKFYTWEECVKLPEVDVVRRIHGHPNIVKLREVIRENNELFFVFEYMDGDLLGIIKKSRQVKKPDTLTTSSSAGASSTAPCIPLPQVKTFMRQILQALAYVHKRGYFHRDMKPENLLIRREVHGEDVVKLADFGLVKEIRARPPFTDYVSTRWYRAPELLLQDRFYSSPVDIWAAGCIMVELITSRPLFPGSNEVDQLYKIMSILGSPTEKSWPGGIALARKIRYTFPNVAGAGVASVLPAGFPAAAIDLVNLMLTYDPKQRLTAEQCLQHPFFSVGVDDCSEPSAATVDQLTNAMKRLQPGPQSAPAVLKGNTANDGLKFGGAGKVPRQPTEVARPESATGAQKYFVSKSPPVQTVSPIAPEAVSAAQSNSLHATSVEADSATGKEPRGPGKKPPLTGPLKNVKLANLKPSPQRRPTDSHVKASAGGQFTSYDGTDAAGGIRSPRANILGSIRNTKGPQRASGAGSGGPPKKSSLQTELSGPTKLSTHGALSPLSSPLTGGGGGLLSSSKNDADATLDALMEDFAAEMSSLGIRAQKQEPTKSSDRWSGNQQQQGTANPTSNSVATLLNNSRYKRMSRDEKENGASSLSAGKTSAMEGSGGAKVQGSLSDPLSPREGQRNTGVTPSIKALLAKHRSTGLTFQ